jgi:hypothetical protein
MPCQPNILLISLAILTAMQHFFNANRSIDNCQVETDANDAASLFHFPLKIY